MCIAVHPACFLSASRPRRRSNRGATQARMLSPRAARTWTTQAYLLLAHRVLAMPWESPTGHRRYVAVRARRSSTGLAQRPARSGVLRRRPPLLRSRHASSTVWRATVAPTPAPKLNRVSLRRRRGRPLPPHGRERSQYSDRRSRRRRQDLHESPPTARRLRCQLMSRGVGHARRSPPQATALRRCATPPRGAVGGA